MKTCYVLAATAAGATAQQLYTANFDDIKTSTDYFGSTNVAHGAAIPDPYQLMSYDFNWAVLKLTNAVSMKPNPASTPNVIVRSDLSTGLTVDGFAASSPSPSFYLDSFSFGCMTNINKGNAAALGCSITLACPRIDQAGLTLSATYTGGPKLAVANVTTDDLSSCSFQVSSATLNGASYTGEISLVLDNIEYEVMSVD